MTTRIFGSRSLAGVLVALAGSFFLIGCDDAYSSLVQYNLRTDPLVLLVGDKFGPDQVDPDRPGVFPIMSPKDLLNPVNPMYPKRDVLFKIGALRDPTLVPTGTSADPINYKKEMKETLDSWFGTPRNPRVKDAPASLGFDNEKLAEGSALYRIHCLHCHGVPGDGRGVTAKWINPHPRDFRQGLFKFQSVDQSTAPSPPRREDLKRTLLQGIEGTAMPAFNLLDGKKIDNLVSYVMHLSIRGQVEFETIANGFEYTSDTNELSYAPDDPIGEYMKTLYDGVLKKWDKAQTKGIKPRTYPTYKDGVEGEEYKASVLRGHAYFIGDDVKAPGAKAFNCVSCHVNYGRQSMFKWDSWGTLVRPNNLTNGIYRGGRRPVDLYYRIHSGINGSGMAAFGVNEKTHPDAVWDLVNFVQVLPYPTMREKLGINID